MPLNREISKLPVIDFQSRLMPAIEHGGDVVANTRRLFDASSLAGEWGVT